MSEASINKPQWIRGRCLAIPRDADAKDWAEESCFTELQIIGPHPTQDQSGPWKLVSARAGNGGKWETAITREIAESLIELSSFQVPPVA